MIGAIFGALVRVAVHAIPTLLGFGTLMGTDRLMKWASHEQVGPWVITGMNALQRAHLIDVANEILGREHSQERELAFMNHKMQIIATCARGRFGYILFDPSNPYHLEKLSRYPHQLLEKAFVTACKLSGLEYLTPEPDEPGQGETKPAQEQSVDLRVQLEQEDDGLDLPEDDEAVKQNP